MQSNEVKTLAEKLASLCAENTRSVVYAIITDKIELKKNIASLVFLARIALEEGDLETAKKILLDILKLLDL